MKFPSPREGILCPVDDTIGSTDDTHSVDEATVETVESEERLQALYRYDILDTDADDSFDRITRLAAGLLEADMAFINFIDRDRQWSKSCFGFDLPEVAVDLSFCVHTIQSEDPLVVEDATKDPRFATNPLVRRDPEIRFYAGAPLITSDGYPVGALCVTDSEPKSPSAAQIGRLRDLAEVVVDELDLRLEVEQRKEVEHTLRQREKSLRAHKNTLQATNERLEAFTGIVAHDLRNPLNTALNWLELAQEKNAVASGDEDFLARVRGALRRMSELLEDLLLLSRDGASIGSVEPVSVGSLARASWENVETDGARLQIQSDRTVRADASRLGQVFENLFKNSVEHGGTDVTVTVGRLPTGFYVEDDGPGIPDDALTKIFEPGFTTDEHGTGFGLPIAKEVVEAHGGTITLRLGETEGARFEIRGLADE